MEDRKTLALNILASHNEAYELDRCLKSIIIKNLFDEIVIVPTTKDPEVWKVARQYTKKVYHFEWIDDFSAARNFARKKTKSDYIFWCDADDVGSGLFAERAIKMKEYVINSNYDLYFIPYYLYVNDYCEGIASRERIYRRTKFFWDKTIHEQLKTRKKITYANFNGISIEHRPTKDPRVGVLRNLRYLKKEYDNGTMSKDMLYYFARDLHLEKKYDKSIQLFEQIINNQCNNPDVLCHSAYCVSQYYTYNDDGTIKKDTMFQGETFARIALSFSDLYAEAYVILGDIYYAKGDINNAIKFLKIAISKDPHKGNGVKELQFYEEKPAEKLCYIFCQLGEFEQAIWYNRLALKHNKSKRNLDIRASIIKALSEQKI